MLFQNKVNHKKDNFGGLMDTAVKDNIFYSILLTIHKYIAPGLPLGTNLANTFMSFYEKICLEK